MISIIFKNIPFSGHSKKYWNPGRLYNLGNIAGFLGGIISIFSSRALVASNACKGPRLNVVTPENDCSGALESLPSILHTIAIYVAGDMTAILLSLATAIFLIAGFAYSKAWENATGIPDVRLNCIGDSLSGAGALIFGAGVMMLGDPVLAASAGVMHAVGKFGSALAIGAERDAKRNDVIVTRFKEIVLMSRLPAICAAVIGFIAVRHHSTVEILLSLNVIFCCLIWVAADFRLLPANSNIRKLFFNAPKKPGASTQDRSRKISSQSISIKGEKR